MKRTTSTRYDHDGDLVNTITDACQHCSYKWTVCVRTKPGEPIRELLEGAYRSASEHAMMHHYRVPDRDECRSTCRCDDPLLEPTDTPNVWRAIDPTVDWLPLGTVIHGKRVTRIDRDHGLVTLE